MIRSDFKNWIRGLRLSLGQNRVLLLVYVALIPLFLYLYLARSIRSCQLVQIRWCIADTMVYVLNAWFTGLFLCPIMLYYVLHLTKYDFSIASIVLHRNKTNLWIRQCAKIGVACLLITILTTIFIFIHGLLQKQAFINWNSTDSLYFNVTKKLNDVSFNRVFFLFFFGLLFIFLTFCLLWLFTRWLTDRHIVGWVVCIAIIAAEHTNASLLINKLYMGHDLWADPSVNLETNLLIPILYIAVIMLLGIFTAKRKDFLHVQQK